MARRPAEAKAAEAISFSPCRKPNGKPEPTETVSQTPEPRDADLPLAVRARLEEQRLDQATRLVADLLEQRVAAGDKELGAARMLLDHYYAIVSSLPPLGHVDGIPLRPSDALYRCFDQFLDMMRQQDGQIRELMSIIDELI